MIALKKATQPIWKLEKFERVLNSSKNFMNAAAEDDNDAAAAAAASALLTITTASHTRFTQESAIEVFANGPQ